MKIIYLCWIDDVKDYIESQRHQLDILKNDYGVDFVIDEHNDTTNFDTIANSFDEGLIFLIDYNLKNKDEEGFDGDEIIKMIRNKNNECLIVFYSSNANQEELRGLVEGVERVVCVARENLNEVLEKIASGELGN